ncbi:DUF2946 domain-containing protein [Rubripirellula obstinata]|uniref:DUF2946 domain-containing protein n=1 Tax=Rubripirellula obstinata TaxID=406547 RepID=UPI00122D2B01|nr:DUF2946 domain-containing protein [Rubripirellula obstinata]
MASLRQKLLVSSLCALLVLGHAFAWLHVATCKDGACGDIACKATACRTVVSDHACCGHSHHHGGPADDNAEANPIEGDQSQQPGPPHDSDSCSICLSLATPCAFGDASFTLPISEPACQRIVLATRLDGIASLLSLPPSRGPPAVVA